MRSSRMWLCVVALGLAAGAVAAEEKTAEAQGGAIVHSVYFWLKETATKENAATMVTDLKEQSI